MASDLTFEDAIEAYLDSVRMTPESKRGYRAVLLELRSAYPHAAIEDFDLATGTEFIARFLEDRWGSHSSTTYNKSVSIVRQFFAWLASQGALTADPAANIGRRATEQEPRGVFTEEQRTRILEVNSDVRDGVPLRLLLDYGVGKGSLRQIRFGDFDSTTRQVTVRRGTRQVTLPIADDEFWAAWAALKAETAGRDDDHVLPKELSRKYAPSSAEQEACIPRSGSPDYLRRDGERWVKVSVSLSEPRGEHGTHIWWYRCLQRAGVVEPGVTRGERMLKARHTVGRATLVRSGRAKDVEQLLGMGKGGSTGVVYGNRDGDQLEATVRRLRLRLRRTVAAAKALMSSEDSLDPGWWTGPVRRFVEYIEEERDLVELSRVSIEMLRAQDPGSQSLQNAAATLTRVVFASDFVTRAGAESRQDYPLLHGHSLVAIWGAMETMALDVVAAWLQNRVDARLLPVVAELKVPYGMFESMEPADRAEAVAQELDRQRGPRSGIERFDRLLSSVGLGGERDTILAKNIFELQQVRHVFAHKRGNADKDFVRVCGYLGYGVGDPILIGRDAWSDVMVNALLYAEGVLRRMNEELGFPIGGAVPRVRAIRWSN